MYQRKLLSSFSTSLFALIYPCHTLVSKCSRRSQFAAAKSTRLSVHLADLAQSSCQSPGEARTALANDDYGKWFKFWTTRFILWTMHCWSNKILLMFTFFSPLQNKGLGLHTHSEWTQASKVPCERQTSNLERNLERWMHDYRGGVTSNWLVIASHKRWFFFFLTMENKPIDFSFCRGFCVVASECCAVCNCSQDTTRGDKKRGGKKLSAQLNIFLALLTDGGVWARNPWRTIGLCHPKKAGPFKIITLFLTRELRLLCRPWPHPSPFSWQPQHGNLVKCGAEIVLSS